MDVLVAGEGIELLDARFDVMARHPLALGDRGEVDPIDHPRVIGDDTLGHLDTEIGLGPEDREPQAALGHDPVLRGPDAAHRRRGISLGEHVGDHGPHPSTPAEPAAASRIFRGRSTSAFPAAPERVSLVWTPSTDGIPAKEDPA